MSLLCRSVCAFAQTGLVLFALIYPYRERLRYSYVVSFFIAFFFSCCYMIPYFLLDMNPSNMGKLHILYTCISMFSLSLLVSYLTKVRLSIMVFSVYVIRNITDSLEVTAYFVYFLFMPKGIEGNVFIPILYLFFLLFLEPLLLLFINRQYKFQVQFSYKKFEPYLWLIPFAYYIFFRVWGDIHHYTQAKNWIPAAFILPLIWFFGTAFSHYIIFNVMAKTAHMASLKEKLKYSELFVQSQLKEYNVIQENLLLTKKLRHDMKHHLVVLDGYLNQNDVTSAQSYLANLITTINSLNIKPYCQNTAMNSILNYFSKKAVENHINVDISVRVGETIPVADTDFCTILGNLFDNALEACLRSSIPDPFITLNIGVTGEQMLVLSIRNSYSGDIHISEGKFISSKRKEPGLGTSSVKYMVEKYNGICNFQYTNNIFDVSILLNPGMKD